MPRKSSYIVDDEADAASLNTFVNKTNKASQIKQTTLSKIYMQVTGTPQAILLQTVQSGWKPYFSYYCKLGNHYLGGNCFYQSAKSPYIVFTDNNEAKELLLDEEFPKNGRKSVYIFLAVVWNAS